MEATLKRTGVGAGAPEHRTARRRAARLSGAGRVLAVVLGGAVLGLPSIARADGSEGRWIDAMGEAPVSDGDVVAAQARATTRALREAVDQVAGELERGLVERPGYGEVRATLAAADGGYVQRYAVREIACDAESCEARVRALVAHRALERRLAELGLVRRPEQERVGEASVLRVTVTGLRRYADVGVLRRAIPEAIPAVSAVRERRWAGGEAELEVHTSLEPRRLAGQLSTRPVGGFTVRVRAVDADGLEIRVEP